MIENIAQLETAYRATDYCFKNAEQQYFSLQIDKPNPAFQKWLAVQRIITWCMLTAANPRSVVLPASENSSRNQQLEEQLIAANFTYFPAEGVPHTSDWETEPSFFIANISLAHALQLASSYEQHAIVFGKKGEVARLIWVEKT